jgi:uncharacterized membrane protein YfcA
MFDSADTPADSRMDFSILDLIFTELLDLAPFILLGFLAQAIDGALGMAFGVIVNAVLVGFLGIAPARASAHVHIAKIFTTAASGLSHYYQGNIDFRLFFRLLIPGLIGGVAGSLLLTNISGQIVAPIVLGYLLLVGVYLIGRAIIFSPKFKTPRFVRLIGAAGGFLDAIGGGGWGPVATSNLLVQGAEPRKVVGTVNSVEFFLTLVISATFILHMGVGQILGPVVGLLIGGVIAAPIGAFLAKYLEPRLMFVLVGIALTLTSGLAILKITGI